MKYVMSDIHGCYKTFLKMLEVIDFTDDDTLYILGDIFDRGPQPLEILDYIINKDNIILIKGNHEKMMEEAYEEGTNRIWKMNGGKTTIQQIESRGEKYKDFLYNYIKNLPYIQVVDNFILAHAYAYIPPLPHDNINIDSLIKVQEEENCLWSRSGVGSKLRFEDYMLVVGHTPVGSFSRKLSENPSIVQCHGTIYIDCGCCFDGKLGCIRLDDKMIFHVNCIDEV